MRYATLYYCIIIRHFVILNRPQLRPVIQISDLNRIMMMRNQFKSQMSERKQLSNLSTRSKPIHDFGTPLPPVFSYDQSTTHSAKEHFFSPAPSYQIKIVDSEIELQRSLPIVSTFQPKPILRQAEDMEVYQQMYSINNRRPIKELPDILKTNNNNPSGLPQDIVNEPNNPNGQPQGIVNEPNNPNEQPKDIVNEPSNPNEQPQDIVTEPTDPTTQPQGIVNEPTDPTTQPQENSTSPGETKPTKKMAMTVDVTSSTHPPYPDGIKPDSIEYSGDYPMCDERAICHKYVWTSKQPKTLRRHFKTVKSFIV
ncbi:hypothetical protein B5X24_HaOG204453 [Helicoverpa armigera]|uniref:Uncharacterized protein n=1 Tax=Helicoverpa armigera TaxID=29058 RepID=A0A2W1BSD1_HELAM|nr:hypothetical protein B5X24_HaOG204453 [Helicoverpa armigera]